jgi:phenylacetate-CoA oxygenase PaaH subunit
MPRYEVFGRRDSDDTMHHVGSVDAPGHKLALLEARQCFSRRNEADEIWLVEYDAVHMFRASTDEGLDKSYREIQSYADLGKRRRLIEANIPATKLSEESISSSGPDLPAS